MGGHPSACARVGARNERSNHRCTEAWKTAGFNRATADQVFGRLHSRYGVPTLQALLVTVIVRHNDTHFVTQRIERKGIYPS